VGVWPALAMDLMGLQILIMLSKSSYLQDSYAGKSANVSIGVENTSASKPGMCLGCAITSRKFAGDNPLFYVRFFEGSSGVNP